MCMQKLRPVPDHQRGLTLIELIVFIVIVGVALAGIAAAINYNVQHTTDPVVKKQALAVAESLLEEIMLQNYSDPDGTNTGESGRTDWDDIDDYNGYSRSGISSVDAPSTTIPGLEKYNVVSVTVDATTAFSGIAAGEVKHITVKVSGPINTTVTLEGYRTNYTGP